jgi:hypothetical protein
MTDKNWPKLTEPMLKYLEFLPEFYLSQMDLEFRSMTNDERQSLKYGIVKRMEILNERKRKQYEKESAKTELV